jgi:hypothetical protein
LTWSVLGRNPSGFADIISGLVNVGLKLKSAPHDQIVPAVRLSSVKTVPKLPDLVLLQALGVFLPELAEFGSDHHHAITLPGIFLVITLVIFLGRVKAG